MEYLRSTIVCAPTDRAVAIAAAHLFAVLAVAIKIVFRIRKFLGIGIGFCL